jgi:hypothetical protein
MSKYSELLKLGKEALDTIKIPFEVRKAEKDLEREIIEIEQKIAEQELEIQKAKSSKPLALKTILNAIDKKDLLERELSQARQLQKELF